MWPVRTGLLWIQGGLRRPTVDVDVGRWSDRSVQAGELKQRTMFANNSLLAIEN